MPSLSDWSQLWHRSICNTNHSFTLQIKRLKSFPGTLCFRIAVIVKFFSYNTCWWADSNLQTIPWCIQPCKNDCNIEMAKLINTDFNLLIWNLSICWNIRNFIWKMLLRCKWNGYFNLLFRLKESGFLLHGIKSIIIEILNQQLKFTWRKEK